MAQAGGKDAVEARRGARGGAPRRARAARGRAVQTSMLATDAEIAAQGADHGAHDRARRRRAAHRRGRERGRVAVPLTIIEHRSRAADLERVAAIAREQERATRSSSACRCWTSGEEGEQARLHAPLRRRSSRARIDVPVDLPRRALSTVRAPMRRVRRAPRRRGRSAHRRSRRRRDPPVATSMRAERARMTQRVVGAGDRRRSRWRSTAGLAWFVAQTPGSVFDDESRARRSRRRRRAAPVADHGREGREREGDRRRARRRRASSAAAACSRCSSASPACRTRSQAGDYEFDPGLPAIEVVRRIAEGQDGVARRR